MNRSIMAYFDDLNLISVEVSKDFYNGQIDSFYLILDEQIIECIILNSYDFDEKVKYSIKCNNDIIMNKQYVLGCDKGYRTDVIYRFITKTKWFNDSYYTDEDLGCIVKDNKTVFNVFAPTAYNVTVKIENDKVSYYDLKLGDKGVFKIEIDQNLDLSFYTYLISGNGVVVETIDPYGKACSFNGIKSIVVDQSNYNKVDIKNTINNYCEAIIYEVSIRDMTSDKKVEFKNKSKFIGLIESNVKYENQLTGFDYICDLGVSHIQLMPVNDFFTVDELYNNQQYNWGYDPYQYMCLEGSYATKLNDDSRNLEFLQMVNAFHKKDIGVILDVVFNHSYDINLSCFNKVVPYYYYRYDNEILSNGSYCGNDLDSKSKMYQKYIVDTCVYYVNTFGIDGFRFDLMGILDIQTMNLIYDTLVKIKPSIMIYGEGWNMPTFLKDDEKAIIANSNKMQNIGFFNDYFRDHIKGATSEDQILQRGYASTNPLFTKAVCNCLSAMANIDDFHLFDNIHQSINYVECHDNMTLFDKLSINGSEESHDIICKRVMLINAMVIFSIGVPFIHSGQEFCRSKKNNHNTYNMDDDINLIDYKLKNSNLNIVEYLKNCISFRKSCDAFIINNYKEFKERVSFEILDDNIIKFSINNTVYKGDKGCIIVYINPTMQVLKYQSKSLYKVFDKVECYLQVNEIQVNEISLVIYFDKA